MSARIDIENASVSYFMRKTQASSTALEEGDVGARILIGKRYMEIAALRDISVSLRKGQRVGLIGINGSGKSTFLKLCAGALSAQRGRVTIKGRVSPQFSLGSGIRPDLSGRRNAELKSLYMGTPQSKIKDYVEEVKILSGLGGYFELPVRSYSAGMRSRLIMSLLHLVRGEILIMDEWISAADASVNEAASTLQSDLVERSDILIMASHSLRVLEKWTDSLIWLNRGEIEEFGPVTETYQKYKAFIDKKP